MAYTPSLQDVNENQSYTPSLSDAYETHPQIQQPPEQSGFLNQLKGGIAGFLGGRSQNLKDIVEPIYALLNTPEEAKQVAGMFPTTESIAQRFGLTNPSANVYATEKTAQFAPDVAAGLAGLMHLGRAAISPLASAFQHPEILKQGIESLTGDIENHAKNILDTVGNGLGFQENAQSAAKDIKGLYQQNRNTSKQGFENFFKQFGDDTGHAEQYYPYSTISKNKMQWGVPKENLSPESKELQDSLTRDSRRLLNKYYSDPSLENAHWAQSQLDSDIRALKRTPLDAAGLSKLSAMEEVQGNVLNDMQQYSQINPGAYDQYLKLKNWHYNNVVPFETDNDLFNISTGKITNPHNLSAIFKSPEPGLKNITDALGQAFKDKLVNNELSKVKEGLTSDKLISQVNSLYSKGLDNYLSDPIKAELNNLVQKRNSVPSLQDALARAQGKKQTAKKVMYGGILGPLGIGGTYELGHGISELLSSKNAPIEIYKEGNE